MQRLAYEIVNTHLGNISCNKEPLCLSVIGVAGTGKRYLINALRNLSQSKCAVTATTGKAAFNLQGITCWIMWQKRFDRSESVLTARKFKWR